MREVGKVWNERRFPEKDPHTDYLKVAMVPPTPQSWAFPGLGPAESLPDPPSHGVAVILFFQFHQRPRETGGGPGVKGNIP